MPLILNKLSKNVIIPLRDLGQIMLKMVNFHLIIVLQFFKEVLLKKPTNFAQQYLSYQDKWKQGLVKQAQRTIADREKREEFLKKFNEERKKGKG